MSNNENNPHPMSEIRIDLKLLKAVVGAAGSAHRMLVLRAGTTSLSVLLGLVLQAQP